MLASPSSDEDRRDAADMEDAMKGERLLIVPSSPPGAWNIILTPPVPCPEVGGPPLLKSKRGIATRIVVSCPALLCRQRNETDCQWRLSKKTDHHHHQNSDRGVADAAKDEVWEADQVGSEMEELVEAFFIADAYPLKEFSSSPKTSTTSSSTCTSPALVVVVIVVYQSGTVACWNVPLHPLSRLDDHATSVPSNTPQPPHRPLPAPHLRYLPSRVGGLTAVSRCSWDRPSRILATGDTWGRVTFSRLRYEEGGGWELINVVDLHGQPGGGRSLTSHLKESPENHIRGLCFLPFHTRISNGNKFPDLDRATVSKIDESNDITTMMTKSTSRSPPPVPLTNFLCFMISEKGDLAEIPISASPSSSPSRLGCIKTAYCGVGAVQSCCVLSEKREGLDKQHLGWLGVASEGGVIRLWKIPS